MADNVTLPGTGESVASDDVGGVQYQRVKIAVGADGTAADLAPGQVAMAASLPVVIASDQSAIPISGGVTATSVTVTPTCEAAAYHAGDVLFDSVEIASAARANGTAVELVSLVARDLDDQTAAALTLFFFNANTSLGTKNAAPDIDDTEILTLVGMLTIPAASWVDVGASKVASLGNLGILMSPGGSTTSLWVAGMTSGTPTKTAGGISLTFQFVRY